MASGLEGVVAAETVLSHTDAAAGMVWVRGHALPELVAEHGFEGMVALLWEGFAGDGLTREGVREAFGAARVAAFGRLDGLGHGRPVYEAMRLGLAAVPDNAGAAEIVGTMTVIVAALARGDAALVAPDPELSTAADLLRTAQGRVAAPEIVAALDTYFTVMAESGLSASSFAGRIVASTRASLAASVMGAWCAFTGALHGGAPGPTLAMIEAAAAAPDLDAWIEARLWAGERLMGFGHRVFQGNDPRSEAMRVALAGMGTMGERLAFAALLEQRVAVVVDRVKPGRVLAPNVEIMAALLLDAVGFRGEMFTPVFGVGRCVGWIAHALEQRSTGRMIRPTSRYVG